MDIGDMAITPIEDTEIIKDMDGAAAAYIFMEETPVIITPATQAQATIIPILITILMTRGCTLNSAFKPSAEYT